MIRYHLVPDIRTQSLDVGLKKISDYLITFVGDIEVKPENPGAIKILYSGTSIISTLKTGNNQITLSCGEDDNLSLNLIKNVTKNIGYRIFNPLTLSYLTNDPNLLNLTTNQIDKNITKVFAKYHLIPLFQYRDSLVFFAQDKKEQIHLVNRHLLEYLINNSQKEKFKENFSVVVARDIGIFVALMDRGLIPISFYKYQDGQQKILNLSGFNIDKLQRNILVEQINFQLDAPKQEFTQSSSKFIEVKKGESLIKHLSLKNCLAIKIPQDVSFNKKGKSLIPKLTISVFLDS